MKMHLKMSSGKWRPFCPGVNELIANCGFSPSTEHRLRIQTDKRKISHRCACGCPSNGHMAQKQRHYYVRNDVKTSFWRNNDVIFTSCVRWASTWAINSYSDDYQVRYMQSGDYSDCLFFLAFVGVAYATKWGLFCKHFQIYLLQWKYFNFLWFHITWNSNDQALVNRHDSRGIGNLRSTIKPLV